MKGERGLTLLEVLVATTIMGVAIVGLMGGLSTSVGDASRLLEYDRASLLARAKMDELIASPLLPKLALLEGPFDPVSLGGARGGWRARVTIFDAAPDSAPGSSVLERIELEVWWMSGSQRRRLPLESFRRAILRPEDMAALGAQPGAFPQ